MHKLIIWTVQVCLFFIVVKGEISNTKLENVEKYADDVLQMLVSDLEYKGYRNLLLVNLNDTINETMYGVEVVGSLRYFNGFVIAADDVYIKPYSIKEIISEITFEASVSSRIIFKGLRFAYDMEAELTAGIIKAIGIYTIDELDYEINIIRNLKTGVVRSSVFLMAVKGKGRIAFQPKNYYTTVIARTFNGMLLENFKKLGFLEDLLQNIVSKKITFPVINYDTIAK